MVMKKRICKKHHIVCYGEGTECPFCNGSLPYPNIVKEE